jgi:hypothetical protein
MAYTHQESPRLLDMLDCGRRVACIGPTGYVALDLRHAVGFSPEALIEIAQEARRHAEACALEDGGA